MTRQEHATEAWLGINASPDQFAAAMGLCQLGADSCVHRGICAFDGDCFKPEKIAVETARACIKAAAIGQPAEVRQAMLLAADLLAQTVL